MVLAFACVILHFQSIEQRRQYVPLAGITTFAPTLTVRSEGLAPTQKSLYSELSTQMKAYGFNLTDLENYKSHWKSWPPRDKVEAKKYAGLVSTVDVFHINVQGEDVCSFTVRFAIVQYNPLIVSDTKKACEIPYLYTIRDDTTSGICKADELNFKVKATLVSQVGRLFIDWKVANNPKSPLPELKT